MMLGQLMPDDRRLEWAPSLREVEGLIVGRPEPVPGALPAAAAVAVAPGAGKPLARARELFDEMQKAYSAGDFARYGQLLQELGRVLSSP